MPGRRSKGKTRDFDDSIAPENSPASFFKDQGNNKLIEELGHFVQQVRIQVFHLVNDIVTSAEQKITTALAIQLLKYQTIITLT